VFKGEDIMAEVRCLNCGHHFELVKTYYDVGGLYTVCPKCGGSFDTDEEVELSSEQTARNDEVYGAVFAMCKVLTENEKLEWNMLLLYENIKIKQQTGNVRTNIKPAWFAGIIRCMEGLAG